MRAVFFSDIHIASPDDTRAQAFVEALRKLVQDEKLTHLFLVGDIFDLWVGPHDYFANRYREIVEQVSALTLNGVEVHYFEGNHDLHVEKFWSRIGVKTHVKPMFFTLADKIVRVEHGDDINPDDKGYVFLKSALRSKPLTWLAHSLPGVAVRAIGERASHASRDYTSNAKALPEEKIRGMIRTHAEAESKKKSFDFIISGHVHVKDDFEVSKGVRSINLGSWYDEPKAFEITEQSSRWLTPKDF